MHETTLRSAAIITQYAGWLAGCCCCCCSCWLIKRRKKTCFDSHLYGIMPVCSTRRCTTAHARTPPQHNTIYHHHYHHHHNPRSNVFNIHTASKHTRATRFLTHTQSVIWLEYFCTLCAVFCIQNRISQLIWLGCCIITGNYRADFVCNLRAYSVSSVFSQQ